MGEISITKLLLIAALVVLLFGTKKLRSLGGDLGAAIKGFKKSIKDDEQPQTNSEHPTENITHHKE